MNVFICFESVLEKCFNRIYCCNVNSVLMQPSNGCSDNYYLIKSGVRCETENVNQCAH